MSTTCNTDAKAVFFYSLQWLFSHV